MACLACSIVQRLAEIHEERGETKQALELLKRAIGARTGTTTI